MTGNTIMTAPNHGVFYGSGADGMVIDGNTMDTSWNIDGSGSSTNIVIGDNVEL